MEEKAGVAAANNQLEKVTSRRSRKDEEGRDFQCGCGKRYLSYPALYTHIKTKHEGRQPEGTLKTGTNLITKRAKAKLEQQTLRAITALFRREQIRIFTELGEGAQGFISVSARIKKDSASKQLHQSYITLIKQKQLRLSPSSPLELALVVYLINMGGFINEKLYEQLLFFARNARSCFAEHAEEIYRGYYSRKDWEGSLYIHGFHNGEVRFFPMIIDFFVQCYLPIAEHREGKKVSASLHQLLSYDFCNWLHLRKLTKLKIQLASDFKLEYTPDAPKPKATPSKIDVNQQQALCEASNSKQHRDEVQQQEDEGSDNQDEEDEGYEQKKPSVGKDRDMVAE